MLASYKNSWTISSTLESEKKKSSYLNLLNFNANSSPNNYPIKNDSTTSSSPVRKPSNSIVQNKILFFIPRPRSSLSLRGLSSQKLCVPNILEINNNIKNSDKILKPSGTVPLTRSLTDTTTATIDSNMNSVSYNLLNESVCLSESSSNRKNYNGAISYISTKPIDITKNKMIN